MLYPVFFYNGTTASGLQEITDARMASITAALKEVQDSTLKIKLNWLLESKNGRWKDVMEALLRSQEGQKVKEWDDEVSALERFYYIDKKERDTEAPSVLDRANSLEQVWEIYCRTEFYFRRLELDIEREACRDFLEFADKWGFSPLYFAEMLKESHVYNRKRAGYNLVKLLMENGRRDCAEQIVSCLEQQGGHYGV